MNVAQQHGIGAHSIELWHAFLLIYLFDQTIILKVFFSTNVKFFSANVKFLNANLNFIANTYLNFCNQVKKEVITQFPI